MLDRTDYPLPEDRTAERRNVNRRWPAEHDAYLSELFRKGIEYRKIAAEINARFGTAYTKNACIGRAERLGLWRDKVLLMRARTVAAIKREETKRKQREPAEVKQQRKEEKAHKRIEARCEPSPLRKNNPSANAHAIHAVKEIRAGGPRCETDPRPLRAADVIPLHLPLNDLKRTTCHWPYGGWPDATPITFCGHQTFDGCSYCHEHQMLSTGRGTPSERAAHRVTEKHVA